MSAESEDSKSDDLSKKKSFSKSFSKIVIKHFLFSTLTPQEIEELVELMQEVHFKAGDKIVVEEDFVDSIYFIIEGHAEVSKQNNPLTNAPEETIIAILKEGESIGLSNTGFFSESGKRTATVRALHDMTLLRLDILGFNRFLHKHPFFDKKITELSELMLKLDFIKQVYPFTQLSKNEIYSLALQIKEIELPPNTIIFHEGESADSCYLLRSGNIEIFTKASDGSEQRIAILEPPQLFGEAALLTTSKRNASVRTINESTLLVLDRHVLLKLLDTSKVFAQSLMGFMVNRFRPARQKNITVHRRLSYDNTEIITLYNADVDKFYNLSPESWFIWQQIDGVQTIHDLTMIIFKKFKVFIPEIICNLLYSMAEASFVIIPTIEVHGTHQDSSLSIKKKFLNVIHKFAEKEFVFTKTDRILSKIYNMGVWILYTRAIKIVSFIFILIL